LGRASGDVERWENYLDDEVIRERSLEFDLLDCESDSMAGEREVKKQNFHGLNQG
jgi:hypothetical protein